MPVLLDFRLTVWYHGLKATQYFSKFTPESIKVLKEDLIALGLPHPRKENISLLSHGAVECFWPSAEQNHVLHKNLIAKTRPTPEFKKLITELSILTITLKELPTPRAPPTPYDAVKHTGLKRPYEQRAPAYGGQSAGTSRSQQTSGKLQNQDSSGYRPHYTPNAGPSTYFSSDDSSRPRKVAKTHSQDFHLSSSYRHSNNSSEPSVPRNISQPHVSTSTPPVNQISSVHHQSPPPHIVKSSSNVNIQPPRPQSKLGSTVVSVDDGVVDAFLDNLDLHSTVPKREPQTIAVSFSPKAKATEVSSNNLQGVHNVRYSPNSSLVPSTVGTGTQGPTTAVDSDAVPGLSISKYKAINAVKTAAQLPTPPTSAPLSDFSLYPNLRSGASASTPAAPSIDSTFLRPGPSVQRIPSASHKSTTDFISPTLRSTGANAPQHATRSSSTQRLADGLKAVSLSVRERSNERANERAHERHDWHRHGEYGHPDRSKALELEKVLKELDVVKKELKDERWSRREDKKLLEAERQRREEAEHALADVRRECRQPFVVPSLLDTFVELSKLTTRGLKVSGSTVLANPTTSGIPPPREHRETEHGFKGFVKGQDAAASKGQDAAASNVSSRTAVQRTVVKHEPFDDVVL